MTPENDDNDMSENVTLRPTQSVQKGDIDSIKLLHKYNSKITFDNWSEMMGFVNELDEQSENWNYYASQGYTDEEERTLSCKSPKLD